MTRRRFLVHSAWTALAGISFPLSIGSSDVAAKSASRLPSLAQLLVQLGPAIATVTLDGVSRTGIMLASRGLVLTVADRGPGAASVVVGDDPPVAARAVAFDRGLLMLAVPRRENAPYATAPVAPRAPRRGAWTAGVFVSDDGVQGSLGGLAKKGARAWTFDLPLPKGGAVFDRRGRFLSVVVEQPSSRRCLAAPPGVVRDFLRDVRKALT